MPATTKSRAKKTRSKKVAKKAPARAKGQSKPTPKPKPAAKSSKAAPSPGAKAARMSDDAVRKATGRDWAEWFAHFDARGASKMAHPQITEIAHELGASDWWSQMVTVAYERARGLRDTHQKADGYSANASKTIDAPVSAAFRAWYDPTLRDRWLPGANLTVRRATPDKSLRITWHAARGDTPVEVNLYSKGPRRSQIAVQHNKLADRPAFEKMKAHWVDRIAALKMLLEH